MIMDAVPKRSSKKNMDSRHGFAFSPGFLLFNMDFRPSQLAAITGAIILLGRPGLGDMAVKRECNSTSSQFGRIPGVFFMKTSQLKTTTPPFATAPKGRGSPLSVTDSSSSRSRLDQFGVDYIEGGFPGSNPRDLTFFAEVGKLKLHHARVAAFGSDSRAGVVATATATEGALERGTPS